MTPPGLRFGLSTHVFHGDRLTHRHFERARAHGFDLVEVFATRTHFDYHSARASIEMRRWLDDLGMSAWSVHAPICEGFTAGVWGRAYSNAAADGGARSEAVKRASLTIVEPVTSGDWTSGVRVYVDADQDASNGYSASSDTLIRQFSNLRNLTISSAPARLAFDGRGRNVSLAGTAAARVPVSSTIPLCIAPSRRDVQVNQAGYVSKSDASC